MAAANVPPNMRYALGPKAFQYTTKMDGLCMVNVNGVTASRYEHFCGENPRFAKHLRTWGKAGTVKVKLQTTPKVADCRTTCMFVGYATDHDGDCYKMWDPVTKRVHVTWDFIWLWQMFYSPNLHLEENKITVIKSGEDDDDDSATVVKYANDKKSDEDTSNDDEENED